MALWSYPHRITDTPTLEGRIVKRAYCQTDGKADLPLGRHPPLFSSTRAMLLARGLPLRGPPVHDRRAAAMARPPSRACSSSLAPRQLVVPKAAGPRMGVAGEALLSVEGDHCEMHGAGACICPRPLSMAWPHAPRSTPHPVRPPNPRPLHPSLSADPYGQAQPGKGEEAVLLLHQRWPCSTAHARLTHQHVPHARPSPGSPCRRGRRGRCRGGPTAQLHRG
jgi:hypothetical protein